MSIIDKRTAAVRMTINAIAMSDRGDDPLAIHVVAASVLNVLRDLIDDSGESYVAQVLKLGVFIAATARMADEPIKVPVNAETDYLIDKIIGGIKDGQIKQASDLTVTLSAKEQREMLSYIVRPYNFLKHADSDPLASLDESDLYPDGVIIHALTALSMISPGEELPAQVAPFLARHNLS